MTILLHDSSMPLLALSVICLSNLMPTSRILTSNDQVHEDVSENILGFDSRNELFGLEVPNFYAGIVEPTR